MAGEPRLAEQKMFGGLAFLIGGNMAVAASGQGGLLVRVDPAMSDKLVDDDEPIRWRCADGDAGVASSRRGRRSHQTPARQMGRARHVLCPLVAREAIVLARISAKRAVGDDLVQGALETASSCSSSCATNISETARRWTGAVSARRATPASVRATTTPRRSEPAFARRARPSSTSRATRRVILTAR